MSPRPVFKPGDFVRYHPGGRGHQSHTGRVRGEPFLLGEIWVVHLHEMDPSYKRGECTVVYAASCDALDLIEAAPSTGEGRTPPPYDEIDPGIRETVRWLYESGFEPCDSGDGRSKFDGTVHDEHDPDMFLRVPNVALIVSPDKLVSEADRLCGMLAGRGIVIDAMGPDEGQPSIQASYDPGRPGDAVIVLLGVDDALLARLP